MSPAMAILVLHRISPSKSGIEIVRYLTYNRGSIASVTTSLTFNNLSIEGNANL
jgi:hypothetical protein